MLKNILKKSAGETIINFENVIAFPGLNQFTRPS